MVRRRAPRLLTIAAVLALIAIARAAPTHVGVAPAQPPPPQGSELPAVQAHVRLPPEMDGQIGQISVLLENGGWTFRTLLGQYLQTPAGLELLPDAPKPQLDPRVILPRPVPLLFGPGRLSDTLEQLLARIPEYELSLQNGIPDITPSIFAHSPTHFLNVPLDHFEVTNVTILEAVGALRHQINPAYVVPRGGTDASGSMLGSSLDDIVRRQAAAKVLFDRRLSLSIDHATPREILNRLVALHGAMWWMARYDAPGTTDAAAPVEANCTIEISTFLDPGVATSLFPMRPPRAPGTAPPARPKPTAALPRDVVVILPTTSSALAGAVSILSGRAQVRLGWETVQAPLTPEQARAAATSSAATPRYDLSGLSAPDALNRILAGLPDYAWRLDGDIYHIAPKGFLENPAVALNTRVTGVDREVASVYEALGLVRSLLGPDAATMGEGRYEPDHVRVLTHKAMHLVVPAGTVRDVLDEIARQHGALSWSVTYPEPTGTAGPLTVGLHGFDNWTVNTGARLRRGS